MGKRLDLQFKCCIILLSLCLIIPSQKIAKKQLNTSQKVSKKVVKTVKIKAPTYATITAVGDTICHDRINAQAYNTASQSYHYTSLFTHISDHFKNKDVCIANLETTISSQRRISGYPSFNSPSTLIDDLKTLGINVVSTANNHCLDTGYQGLVSTLNTLDDKQMAHTGTYRTPQEQNKILIKNLHGIKTAFLSFTYGTNYPLNKTYSYAINKADQDTIKRQITLAKKQGAEAIIASMHWGVEYQLKENKTQDDLSNFLIQNGVNVILGSHPHVLEPMKKVTIKDDQGITHQGFVIYSLGNFFSSQVQPHTHESIILDLRLKKYNKQISVDQISYTPLYNYQVGNHYTLYDLNHVITNYEKGNSEHYSTAFYLLAKKEKAQIASILGGTL